MSCKEEKIWAGEKVPLVQVHSSAEMSCDIQIF